MLNHSKTKEFVLIPDPYAQREAEKYAKPIPSRELILQLLEQSGRPLKRKQIERQLGLEDEEQVEALRRRLRAMERDGQLIVNRNQCYCLVNRKDLITGRVLGHPDGFGFLQPDDGSDDLFLSPREMNALLHNDRAVVRIGGVDRKGRREAAVVEILERNTKQIVGRFYKENGVAFVVPDNKYIAQNVLIGKKDTGKAKSGQIVIADIIEQPTQRMQPIGKVTEVLGEHLAPGMEIEVAIRSYQLPFIWPEAVETEIAPLSSTVPNAAKQNRTDLRGVPLITIDGEDARDFDDAVFCQKIPQGWKLLVAIADVSHYVKPGTALDQEAQNRSTSVYFPERVIPMLPEILSNGLCSLNPDEDRLCMVCEMTVNAAGRVTRSKFYDAVMRSHARMTYTQVAKIVVDKDTKLQHRFAALLPHILELHALYQAMRSEREARGAMEFDTQETRIVFGAERKIERIVPVVRNDAHRLIEEFMIAANRCAAKYLTRKKIPRLLRIHEGPPKEKLLDLRTFLGELGLSLGGGANPKPHDYMQLVRTTEGRPDAHLIQTVLLRSLSQAVYSPETKGHFGLALDLYTHFTSPIRRYPDLLVHRAIRHCLQGKPVEMFHYGLADMTTLGEHCSANERRADEATREAVSWLKCEYMLDKIGEHFDGIISAVTSFGLFVELADIYVEGLVHISTLGQDYFHFDPISRHLYGERTGMHYRLGDSVRVVVVRVDLDEKKIDFELPPKPRSKTNTAARQKKRKNAQK